MPLRLDNGVIRTYGKWSGYRHNHLVIKVLRLAD
jgi:hypothetical protein